MNENSNIIYLGFYLNRVFSRLVNVLNNKLENERIPINHAQFEAMQLLWNIGKERLSQQEIADIIGRDKAAVSRALTQLEKHGYVMRTAVSGSKNGISLTLKGRELQPVLEAILTKAISELCQPLSEDESRELAMLLNKISLNYRNFPVML